MNSAKHLRYAITHPPHALQHVHRGHPSAVFPNSQLSTIEKELEIVSKWRVWSTAGAFGRPPFQLFPSTSAHGLPVDHIPHHAFRASPLPSFVCSLCIQCAMHSSLVDDMHLRRHARRCKNHLNCILAVRACIA